MADSEVWTTEDIDDIDSVIQLKPHQKDVEFTTVTKTSDGDLVSIDELYEKTGQESIDKIIDGFNSLLTRSKLTKEHGLLLRVEGAESWMELPDRMNVVKGGENFLKNIAQTFIDIIMAIINFIKGVCNWIWTRFKSLFGFAKTEEETRYICQRSDEFKQETAKVFATAGIPGFDPDELIEELPDNMMPSEMLSVTKSKFKDSKNLVIKYKECNVLTDNALILLKKCSEDVDKAAGELSKIMVYVRKIINNSSIKTTSDTVAIAGEISSIANKYLDPAPVINAFKEMAESFYGIDPSNLGADKNIIALKERVKNQVETVKVRYNKKLYVNTIKLFDDFKKSSKVKLDEKAGKDIVERLKTMIDKSNTVLIKAFADETGNENVKLAFLEYAGNARTYTTAIEQLTKLTQEVKATIDGLIRLHTKTRTVICGLATHDLKVLTEVTDKFSKHDQKHWDKANPNTDIFHFETLNEQFLKSHPNGKLEKQTSDAVASLIMSDKGKGVMRAFGNYMDGLKR